MLFKQDNGKLYSKVLYSERNALFTLKNSFVELMPKNVSEIVIVCIGTDRSTGDSYGPLVGNILSKRRLNNITIFGTLEKPVHAMNLEETLQYIQQNHPFAFIIGIDAALGRLKSVGHIYVSNSPVKPGAGVNKVLPPVGNLSITGVVNVSGYMEYAVLQNTRLHTVFEMAELTANFISLSLRNYSFQKSTLSNL